MEKHWSQVWHQAITSSPMGGKAFGWYKTVAFPLVSPVSGERVRVRLCNRLGAKPAQIGQLVIIADGKATTLTLGGAQSFSINPGESCCTDPCDVTIARGDTFELRLYYTSPIVDGNAIEQDATLVRGNFADKPWQLPMRKPLLAKLIGISNAIPAIEAVEVLTDKPAQAIVAFGDSITAMSYWTKPLGRRLAEAYPGEYVLLNSGISGNCLLYEVEGPMKDVFGKPGVERFEHDVLDVPNLHTVIFGMGVNDVAYLSEETAGIINLDTYQRAVTDIAERLHERRVRMAMQTITPRLGVARTMGIYTREMEDLRLQLNDWIRSNAELFDYVFDAEAVVRDQHEDGWYFREGIHMGDHLHPNAEGGQLLADAWDLGLLLGR